MTARTSFISISFVSLFGLFLASCGTAERSTSGSDALTVGAGSSAQGNLTPSTPADANQEIYPGYKVVCHGGFEETVTLKGNAIALRKDAEAICANKGKNKKKGKNGINSFTLRQSVDDVNVTVEEEAVEVETIYTGFYVLCQDGSSKTKQITASLENLYQEAETFCAGKKDRTTGKPGIAQYAALDAMNPAPSPAASSL